MSWLLDKTADVLNQVKEYKSQDLFPFFQTFGACGAKLKHGRRNYVNLASEDYLGLSQHPLLVTRAQEALRKTGANWSNLPWQGMSERLEALEYKIGQWIGFPASKVASSDEKCLNAIFSSFLDEDALLFVNKNCGLVTLQAVQFARGNFPRLQVRFYDSAHLAKLREWCETATGKRRMVLVEGISEMDGASAPLDRIVDICQATNSALVLYDAHGIGALGPTGRGVVEIFNVRREVDILVGSLRRSLGGQGAFVAAHSDIVSYLKVRAPQFVLDYSLSPAQIEVALAAIQLIESDKGLFRRLEQNRNFFREGLLSAGFDLGASNTQIIPIYFEQIASALTLSARLFDEARVLALPPLSGVTFQTDFTGLRCTVTAAHKQTDLGYALEMIGRLSHDLGLSKNGTKAKSSKRWALGRAGRTLRGIRHAGLPYLTQELADAKTWASSVAKGVFRPGSGSGESEANVKQPPDRPRA